MGEGAAARAGAAERRALGRAVDGAAASLGAFAPSVSMAEASTSRGAGASGEMEEARFGGADRGESDEEADEIVGGGDESLGGEGGLSGVDPFDLLQGMQEDDEDDEDEDDDDEDEDEGDGDGHGQGYSSDDSFAAGLEAEHGSDDESDGDSSQERGDGRGGRGQTDSSAAALLDSKAARRALNKEVAAAARRKLRESASAGQAGRVRAGSSRRSGGPA